jgi:uncharacterized protein (TIGR00725 family)
MAASARRRVIGVMGAGACDAETAGLAEEVGRRIAEAGAVLVCGGRGGVMEAAARGASRAGGLVVGVLPGRDDAESPPNAFVDIAVFTGMRDGRNWINACTSDAVIAISGGWGTLSEVALAMKLGKPVVLLRSWRLEHDDAGLDRPLTAATPGEAVAMVLEALR